MQFYLHDEKHRDERHKTSGGLGATTTTAGDGAAMRKGTTLTTTTNASTTPTKPNADAQSNTTHALRRNQRELKIILKNIYTPDEVYAANCSLPLNVS